MGNDCTVLEELIEMSLGLAQPERDLVILGEGNTAAKIGDGTFWVKASGAKMCASGRESFVQVRSEPLLALLDGPDLSDDEIKEAVQAACVASDARRPSVETILHALLLEYDAVNFVGHTHPVSVNGILCSNEWDQIFSGRVFPDEIVSCGREFVLVPYTDPGLPLARAVRDRVADFAARNGEPPRTILIQNHGLIAAGNTPAMVDAITAMLDKTARVLMGARLCGGIHAFSEENVNRIATRPDELYRQKGLDGA